MKLIVITRPDFYASEVEQILSLLQHGLEYLHLRKPEATPQEISDLLDQIPSALHPHIVLHEHFALSQQYAVRGVHLNRRHALPPTGFRGEVSRSCHSLEEVKEWKPQCSYLFLSPIFDSISKQGYTAAFSPQQLAEACSQGIIDQQVVALGGVTCERIGTLKAMGFGGAALLGDVWQQPAAQLLPHFLELRKEALR